MIFQWLFLAYNVPTEILLEVLATTKPPRAPLLCLMGIGYNQIYTSSIRWIELHSTKKRFMVTLKFFYGDGK
jgi:hypothetical protein